MIHPIKYILIGLLDYCIQVSSGLSYINVALILLYFLQQNICKVGLVRKYEWLWCRQGLTCL